MAGIYLHIPFCKHACTYCNFHFSTSLKYKNDFISALLKEIRLQREYLDIELIDTVYFGGGTPSLLDVQELEQIIQELFSSFIINPEAEITIEANPDDISVEKLKGWKSSGINRLSIGVQSFFDEDLIWMNRAHNARQSLESIEHAKQNGFDNITIDLIYGSPTLSTENWKRNLEHATQFDIPHLSCYALTVEPKTILYKLIEKKKITAISSDHQATQFLVMHDFLKSVGYEHYEISNFAKPGLRSRHNSSYWQGKKYLGLGPSAHSYNQFERRWNIADNKSYIESINKGIIPSEKEILTETQKLNEYIMISLRTAEGCDLKFVEENFGAIQKERILKNARQFIYESNLILVDKKLILTREGKLFADRIASDLFF